MEDVRVRTMKQKRPTCPTSMQLPEMDINLSNSQCVTPKKKEEADEDEQLMEDSDSDRSMDKDSSDSDAEPEEQDQDEKILEKDEEMKKKEIEEIRAFAIANGFDVQIEEEKPKRGVITKERLDAQQKIDEAEFIKSMYVPPPLEILHRKYTNKEPVRTGFN